jgi:lipopolysaccharide/colanic/teichoic acid biosynthesis glycosyltransferase
MTRGKRAFDVASSLLGLIVLAPLFLAIAVLVKGEHGGPVFYRQWRVGYRSRRFRLWKFRTMTPHAAAIGPAITVGDDARITAVGAVLRRFKLDELPQLLNVVAGEMSLVGPRPEVWRYVQRYTPEQRRVLDLVPGITDPGSLEFRDEATLLASSADWESTYVEDVMPAKIRASLDYADRATRWSDLAIVLRTLLLVARPRRRRDDAPSADVQRGVHIIASRRLP